MRAISLALALAFATPGAMLVQTTTAQAATPAYSTSGSTIGTLLANPKTKAVLVKYVPDIANSDQISMASGMTLKAIQSYAGDTLSDDVLAKIDAELAKIPA